MTSPPIINSMEAFTTSLGILKTNIDNYINVVNTKIESLKKNKSAAEVKLQQKTKTNEIIEKQIQDLNSKKAIIKAKLNEPEDKRVNAIKKVIALTRQLDSHILKISNPDTTVREKSNKMTILISDIEKIKNKELELKLKLNTFETENDSLDAEIKRLENELTTSPERTSNNGTNLNQKSVKIEPQNLANLKARQSGIQNQISETNNLLAIETADLKVSIEKLQKTNIKLIELLRALDNNSIDQADNDNKPLDLNEINPGIAEIAEEISKKINDISTLNIDIEDKKLEFANIEKQEAALEQESSECESKMKKLNNTIIDLNKEINELTRLVNSRTTNIIKNTSPTTTLEQISKTDVNGYTTIPEETNFVLLSKDTFNKLSLNKQTNYKKAANNHFKYLCNNPVDPLKCITNKYTNVFLSKIDTNSYYSEALPLIDKILFEDMMFKYKKTLTKNGGRKRRIPKTIKKSKKHTPNKHNTKRKNQRHKKQTYKR